MHVALFILVRYLVRTVDKLVGHVQKEGLDVKKHYIYREHCMSLMRHHTPVNWFSDNNKPYS